MHQESKIVLPRSKIKTATYEAIYWWNRTEGYYHHYFSRLNELHSDDKLFKFFVKKVFEVFLSDYSVRRNIASGSKNVQRFVNELVINGYFQRVKDGDQKVIDEISNNLRNSTDLVNRKHTRSLLSKAAFLINPERFSLIDTYSRESLWGLVKDQKKVSKTSLGSYSIFVKEVDVILSDNLSVFQNAQGYLSGFPHSRAHCYFKFSPTAFRRRVFDKFLWINKADQEGNQIFNNAYPEFFKF